MANQMIALQARAPQQSSVLGPAIQQGAQMLNMMRQQEVADRQAASAAKSAEIAASQEARAVSKEARDAEQAKIQRLSDVGKIFRDSRGWAKFGDEGALQNLRDLTVSLVPELDKIIPQARALATDIDAYNKAFMTAEQLARATVGPRETEVVQDENGDYFLSVTGGFGPQGVIPLNTLIPGGPPKRPAPKPAPAPRGGPAAPAGMPESVGARATRGAFTTPQDLLKQGVNPRSIPSGNPLQPMSMTQGRQPDLAGIVQNMMQTGVVSQSDFEAMRAAAPGKDAQLAEILRSNNIKIMPDEQQPGGFQSAVYRPGEGDASMTQAQSLEGYQDTGRQFRGKSPMVGPLPGSAQVPIPRVREEAKAQRKTPQETYEETRSTEQAKKDADFLETVTGARKSAKQSLSVIDSMIGDARLNKAGQIEIPRGGRSPHPGFEDVVGATWRPGWRFIPGTDAADFDAYLTQAQGSAFLEGFDKLRGGGPITEKEGEKATAALTRMKRAISEKEFVKAARELRSIIAETIAKADEREARLKGTAPRSETKRGATIDDLVKRYGG